MQKYQVIKHLVDSKIIAIVRDESTEKAIDIAAACYKGGIKALEITYSVPDADKVIKKLRAQFSDCEMMIGAGTVVDSETAYNAIKAGARYIVAPNFNKDTAQFCNRHQVAYIPGCFTVTEIMEALENGVEIIKLFPASAFKPSIINAIHGPLPKVILMPTGGISLDNVVDWFKAGCSLVGVGGKLTESKDGNLNEVTERCEELVATVMRITNI